MSLEPSPGIQVHPNVTHELLPPRTSLGIRKDENLLQASRISEVGELELYEWNED